MLIMSSEKTKKLLDDLKSITAKTDRFARKPTPSSTNRWWPGTSFGSLPQSYDKAKRLKDDDGDELGSSGTEAEYCNTECSGIE